MDAAQPEKSYYLWGQDRVVYGPVSAAKISEWVATGDLKADAWIFSHRDGTWRRATDVPELKEIFAKGALPLTPADKKAAEERKTAAQMLRDLELFKGLSDAQIESFARYAQVVHVDQFTRIAKKGDPGDAMYIVLEGEVRAFLMVDGRECTLGSIRPGEFLGEISLLDEGPRSADMAANVDTTLLRISTARFNEALREAPALTAPFLLALSRTVVARVRKTTQRYEDSVRFLGRNASGGA
jgi:hypothetical protein